MNNIERVLLLDLKARELLAEEVGCKVEDLESAFIQRDDALRAITRALEQPSPVMQTTPAETSNARGEVEYEYEVWQGDALQAGGREADYASATLEANHYAMMYSQDGPVEVIIYEKRRVAHARRPQQH